MYYKPYLYLAAVFCRDFSYLYPDFNKVKQKQNIQASKQKQLKTSKQKQKKQTKLFLLHLSITLYYIVVILLKNLHTI